MEKKKKLFNVWNVVAIIVMIILIVLISANVYAANNGYGNVFFMIKTMFSNEEVTGKENLLSDREITISYSSIEIADGLKIQIQKMVLEKDKATLYVYVNDETENSSNLPLNYKVYDNSNNLIARYDNNPFDGNQYTEEININKAISENDTIRLEICHSEKLLSNITINLSTKELLVNGEAVVSKVSEVELRKYLGIFAPISAEAENETDLKLNNYTKEDLVISVSMWLNREIRKSDSLKREEINNIIDSFYNEEIKKENGIIKTGNMFGYDKNTDSYVNKEPDFGTYKCLDVSNISYKNGIYKMNFIYASESQDGSGLEEQPQYEATIELKVNENTEYSKYKVISISEGKLLKSEKNTNKIINNTTSNTDTNTNTALNLQDYIGTWYENKQDETLQNSNYLTIKSITDNQITFDFYLTRTVGMNNVKATLYNDNGKNMGAFNHVQEHQEVSGYISFENNQISLEIQESKNIPNFSIGMVTFKYNNSNQQTKNITALSDEEKEKITAFLNDKENNGFVDEMNIYSSIEDCDLNLVFYNSGFTPVKGEEEDYLKIVGLEEQHTDIFKVTTVEAQKTYFKTTGKHITKEELKNRLSNWIYMEKYDAFYSMHGDTNYDPKEIGSSTVNEMGEYVLGLYNANGYKSSTVTLRANGDNYIFISNIK